MTECNLNKLIYNTDYKHFKNNKTVESSDILSMEVQDCM